MTDWIWINGQTLPKKDARIAVDDRGFQFADGVYEVIRVYGGRPFTLNEHLERLERSAQQIAVPLPVAGPKLAEEIRRFIAEHLDREGMIYLQLTRGVADRNHAYPATISPTLLFYATPLEPLAAVGAGPGQRVLPVPDERWKRCHIKSIALLPNVLAKNHALAEGYDEAVFIDDGLVTEGSVSNFFAVIDGQVITPPQGPKILPGITRAQVLALAPAAGLKVVERPLRESEMSAATEMFLTSSTKELMWVSKWGERRVSETIGPLTRTLHEAFRSAVARATST